MTDQPVQGRCRDCGKWEPIRHSTGYCPSLKMQTFEWWTGCNRWVAIPLTDSSS